MMRTIGRFVRDTAAALALALAVGFAGAAIIHAVEVAQVLIGVEPPHCFTDTECCTLAGDCEVPW